MLDKVTKGKARSSPGQEKSRIALVLKQLDLTLAERITRGSAPDRVTRESAKVTNFGVFVALDRDLAGLSTSASF